MNLIKKIMKLVIKAVSFVFKKLLRLIPVRNRVFFYSIRSDGELKDNCALVYNALDCKKKMFAKKLPHPVYVVPKVFYYMCTSRVIVTDDYIKYLRSVKLRPGQKVVQLWHAGGAFKRFGLDAPSTMSRQDEINTHSAYSDVFVTSEYVRGFYAQAFGIDIEKVKALGSPRTDAFFDKENINRLKEKVYRDCPELKNKKLYIYFPTFREKEGERIVFNPQIDWDALENALDEDEVFIISRHPAVDYDFIPSGVYSKIKDHTEIPTECLIAVSDVVITDYSSVIFDSSLLGKPSVFYCPDGDEYERDFYLDYPDDLPGPVISRFSELLNTIRNEYINVPSDRIDAFIKKEMSACDGHSTGRIAGYIKRYITDPSL